MSESLGTALGRRLRALRVQRAMTIEALAERAGLDSTFVGSVERGRANPSVATLAKVCAALDIEVATLLTDIDVGDDPAALRRLLAKEAQHLDAAKLRVLLHVVRSLRV